MCRKHGSSHKRHRSFVCFASNGQVKSSSQPRDMLAGTRERLQGLLESCRGNAAGALASLAVAGFLVTGTQT